MKKLLFLFAILLFSSCSKEDINEPTPPEDPTSNMYKFIYSDECGGDITGSFCVTKEDLDEAMEDKYWITDTCFKIRIKNPDGETNFYIFKMSFNHCD